MKQKHRQDVSWNLSEMYSHNGHE